MIFGRVHTQLVPSVQLNHQFYSAIPRSAGMYGLPLCSEHCGWSRGEGFDILFSGSLQCPSSSGGSCSHRCFCSPGNSPLYALHTSTAACHHILFEKTSKWGILSLRWIVSVTICIIFSKPGSRLAWRSANQHTFCNLLVPLLKGFVFHSTRRRCTRWHRILNVLNGYKGFCHIQDCLRVCIVQASTNTILLHFLGILFANWTLRILNKDSKSPLPAWLQSQGIQTSP